MLFKTETVELPAPIATNDLLALFETLNDRARAALYAQLTPVGRAALRDETQRNANLMRAAVDRAADANVTSGNDR